MTISHPKRWAYLIGIGVALFPVHNLWITQFLTTKDGVTQAFIPALGAAIWIIASLYFCYENYPAVATLLRRVDKKIIVPLLVIAGAISLSGLAQNGNGTFLDDLMTKLAPFFTAIVLLSTFAASRLLGEKVFYPLAFGSVIVSVGVIAHALVFPGQITGGFVFAQNYDIVVGYVILGTVLFIHTGRYWLTSLSLIAMFLTGSPEGVFSTAVIGLFLVIREVRKRNIKAFTQLVLPVIVVAGLWFSTGYGQELYDYTLDIATETPAVAIPVPTTTSSTPTVETYNEQGSPSTPRKALSYRFEVIGVALRNVEPLGSGLVLTAFKEGIVHNVPLILVQQLGYPGIAGAVAWLWICLWELWKTPWKYGWLAMLSLGVWDHYVFTQLLPIWWMLIGVSAGTWIKNDLILKRERTQNA